MWRAGNIATYWNDLRHRKEAIVQGQMRQFDLKDLFAAILSKFQFHSFFAETF
jgi:hypothetical protein